MPKTSKRRLAIVAIFAIIATFVVALVGGGSFAIASKQTVKPKPKIWNQIGTCKLYADGLTSIADLRSKLSQPGGKYAYVFGQKGYSSAQVKALATGEITARTMKTGQMFDWLSFCGPTIQGLTVYTGPSAPAYVANLLVSDNATGKTYTTSSLSPIKTRPNGSKYRVKTTKTYPILRSTYDQFMFVVGCANNGRINQWSRTHKGNPTTSTEIIEGTKPPKPPTPPTPPTPPGTSTIGLTKAAVVNQVIGSTSTQKDLALKGGEFSFELATAPKSDPTAFKVDGIVYNGPSGTTKSGFGTRTVGDVVRFCEAVDKAGVTNNGFKPNVPCVTFTVVDDASKNVASFINSGTDYCINLPGLQPSIPPGMQQDGAGNCYTPGPPPVAVKHECKAEAQPSTAKLGQTVFVAITAGGPTSSDPVIDWGDGASSNVPYYAYDEAPKDGDVFYITVTVKYSDGAPDATCTTKVTIDCPPPAVDVCPNLPGDQANVPEGYVLENGKCKPCPPPKVDVCPNLPGDQANVPEGYVLENGKCKPCPPPKVDCEKQKGKGWSWDSSKGECTCPPDQAKPDKGKGDHGDKGKDNDHGSSYDSGNDNNDEGGDDGGES